VNELGLSISSADYLVANLSGGQRQGIAIGRAMYFKAKIVLLDEPTTALSVKEVNKVLNLVLEFKKANISVVFITHNIQQVYEIADRFIIMENGKKIKDIAKDATSIKDLTSTIVGD
jgi:simple sugar transport system ATP-binding protein